MGFGLWTPRCSGGMQHAVGPCLPVWAPSAGLAARTSWIQSVFHPGSEGKASLCGSLRPPSPWHAAELRAQKRMPEVNCSVMEKPTQTDSKQLYHLLLHPREAPGRKSCASAELERREEAAHGSCSQCHLPLPFWEGGGSSAQTRVRLRLVLACVACVEMCRAARAPWWSHALTAGCAAQSRLAVASLWPLCPLHWGSPPRGRSC